MPAVRTASAKKGIGKGAAMLEYHAAFYWDAESRWFSARVLDFPGANSQGRTLNSARRMVRAALKLVADYRIDNGIPLPKPDAHAFDSSADTVEAIRLSIHVRPGTIRETAKAPATPKKTRVRARP
jgi:predicted RNase H-like HicB family nuclease